MSVSEEKGDRFWDILDLDVNRIILSFEENDFIMGRITLSGWYTKWQIANAVNVPSDFDVDDYKSLDEIPKEYLGDIREVEMFNGTYSIWGLEGDHEWQPYPSYKRTSTYFKGMERPLIVFKVEEGLKRFHYEVDKDIQNEFIKLIDVRTKSKKMDYLKGVICNQLYFHDELIQATSVEWKKEMKKFDRVYWEEPDWESDGNGGVTVTNRSV